MRTDEMRMYSRQDAPTLSGYTWPEPQPGFRSGGIPEKPSEEALDPVYRCPVPASEDFVWRSELERLVTALVSGARTGGATALVGAEGAGKTALARAACWDGRVRAAFPDGVFWLGLPVTDLREAGSRFDGLLAGRRALLVVDGAGSAADLAPFEVLPYGCALLVTARETWALPAGARRIEVGPLAVPEAVALLRRGLPCWTALGANGAIQALARRLGSWPSLLALVNRRLQERCGGGERRPLSEMLLEVDRALDVAGFVPLHAADPGARRAAAGAAVALALGSLTARERDSFLDLAVFPAEEDVPLSLARRLWGVGAAEARRLARRLQDLALLDHDGGEETLRLHSWTAAFLAARRAGDLPLLHGRLLDAVRPASGQWADLEPASGLWPQLADHLLAAGRGGELRAALLDLAFLQARLAAGGVHALTADCELAAAGCGDAPELAVLAGALRPAAGALAADPAQLAPQLLGRLDGRSEEGLRPLLEESHDWRREAWLRPVTASFLRPGETADGGTAAWRGAVPDAVDGRLAVTADGMSLRVWDPGTGETVRTLEGHAAGISALVPAEGGRVVSGSRDRTLRVWELATGRTLCVYKGHGDWISTVVAVAGGLALSGACDGGMRLWDLETGVTVRRLEEHRHGVTALAAWRGGAVSGSVDGTLRVWDLAAGRPLQTLEGHAGAVTALALLSGGRAVSASLDGTLRAWDLEGGKTLAVLDLDFPVRTLAAGLGGRAFTAGDEAGRTHILELIEPEDHLTGR